MWPQAASRSPSADKPRTQPHRLSLDKQQLAPKGRKSGFSERQANGQHSEQAPRLADTLPSPRLADTLPSPPPLPAGKGSTALPVGASREDVRLRLLPPVCR